MDIERQVGFWREGAEEDMDVAGELMERKRYRHALFFAEVALEKLLKALVVQETAAVPPKTHDLLQLLQQAGIDSPDERRLFLARFQQYNIEGRYPEHMPDTPSREEADKGIDECRETIEWLSSLFR